MSGLEVKDRNACIFCTLHSKLLGTLWVARIGAAVDVDKNFMYVICAVHNEMVK